MVASLDVKGTEAGGGRVAKGARETRKGVILWGSRNGKGGDTQQKEYEEKI